jgi:hypothetical protein
MYIAYLKAVSTQLTLLHIPDGRDLGGDDFVLPNLLWVYCKVIIFD